MFLLYGLNEAASDMQTQFNAALMADASSFSSQSLDLGLCCQLLGPRTSDFAAVLSNGICKRKTSA